MSNQGEVGNALKSQLLENSEIVDKLVFIKVLSLQGFSLLSLPSCPPFPRKFFKKPAVSATNVQSAHSANKWNKKVNSFSAFLTSLKKKKCLSFLKSSQFQNKKEDENPQREEHSPKIDVSQIQTSLPQFVKAYRKQKT